MSQYDKQLTIIRTNLLIVHKKISIFCKKTVLKRRGLKLYNNACYYENVNKNGG